MNFCHLYRWDIKEEWYRQDSKGLGKERLYLNSQKIHKKLRLKMHDLIVGNSLF